MIELKQLDVSGAVSTDYYKVIVHFGPSIPADAQGPVMLAMEKSLREAGYPALVEKQTKEDDSKLRLRMTDEERAKL